MEFTEYKDDGDKVYRREYTYYKYDPAIVDEGICLPVDSRREIHWQHITEAVRDCVAKTISKTIYAPKMVSILLSETEDIAQDVLVCICKNNKYDPSKAPKKFKPRCWGFLTMICTSRVLNRMAYYSRKKRAIYAEADLVEPSIGIEAPTTLYADVAIDTIHEAMDEMKDEGKLTPQMKRRAQKAIEDLQD